MIPIFIQVSGGLSESDLSTETRHPQTGADTAEDKVRNKLFELAMKMSEKETSSGEDQGSESKTESENQKESLSSEDNSQSIQEELMKVRAENPPADSSVPAAGVWGKVLYLHRNGGARWGQQRALSQKWPPPCTWESPREPFRLDLRDSVRKPACALWKPSKTSHLPLTVLHQHGPSVSSL